MAFNFMERFKAAKSKRENWENLYRDAQDYFCPDRQTFDDTVPGQVKRNDPFIFDSTAEEAIAAFSSNLQSSLVPPMKRWTKLELGPGMQSTKQAKAILEDIENRIFAGLRVSNFDTQIASSFYDLAIGTAALLVFKGDTKRPFRFCSVPLSQLYLDEGVDGRIDTAFREFKLRYDLIERHWPDAEIHQEVKEDFMENPDKEIKLIEGSYPGEIEIIRGGKKVKTDGYIYEVYVDGYGDRPIVKRTELTSPWIIYRWSNVPGEVYGRGPALIALADVKSLNETKKILLENGSINGLGMYTVLEDDIMNIANAELKGGALLPVSSNEGGVNGRSIAPLSPAGNPDMSQMIIKDLQESIKRVMFGSPLGDVNLPVKTATEISLRQQDLAKRIGSAFGKLQYELLAPLIKRLIDILYELGMIETDSSYVNGTEINIEYQSPLAQAQDEEDIARVARFTEMVVNTVGPQGAAFILDLQETFRYQAEKMSLPSRILVTKEQAEEMQKKIVEMQAQMAQAQQQGQPQQ